MRKRGHRERGIISRHCEYCGKLFDLPHYGIRMGVRFCSNGCARLGSRKPVDERFDARWIPEPNSGCWLWTGKTVLGYGMFWIDQYNLIPAHRFSWQREVGPIPEGLDIDHLCRVRACINPRHLEPVTRKVNILRGEGACAKHARQTHCKRGHELIPENVYNYGTTRNCKPCAIQRSNDRYARIKAQGGGPFLQNQ